MLAFENIILAAVSVFAFALTLIAVLAFRRTHDIPILFLAGAFGVFFAKGLLLTLALFTQTFTLSQLFIMSGALDLVILALFYGFTLRR